MYRGLEMLPVDFAPMLAAVQMDMDTKIQRLLEAVGIQTVAYLRSYTAVRRPPVRKGEGTRAAHPGGWSDVTSNLMNAYAWRVERAAPPHAGWTLVLVNTMAYAAHLEARDGYFVLSGVTEKGGPVEKAIRDSIAKFAPGWTVV